MKAHSAYAEFWKDVLAQYGDPVRAYKKTGLLLPISGGAGPGPQGFNEVADLILTATVDGADLNDMWDEFQRSLRILNSQRDPLIERLTFSTTGDSEEVMQLSDQEFEKADEFVQPVGLRLGPRWNLGFTLGYFDLATRYTFRFLAKVPAQQLRAINASALEASRRLIFKEVLTAAFRNTTLVAKVEDSDNTVNVYPFYNGDNFVPPAWKSHVHTTGHNHYIVSGATTVDSGDLDTMEDHLYHHGYLEGGDLILIVNRADSWPIRAFRISTGARYDFIPKRGESFYGELVGTQPSNESGLDVFPGFMGTYGPWNIVAEDYVPTKYLFGFVSGGAQAERNPLGLRDHPNSSLRGLKLIPRHEHYPLIDSYYHQTLGSGVRHRGAAVLTQLKASGSYDTPTLTLGGAGGR